MNLGRIAVVTKGEYNPALEYKKLDLISYLGSSYYAKKNVPSGKTPPTNLDFWQVASLRGEKSDNTNPITGNAYESNAPSNDNSVFKTYKVVEPISNASDWYAAATAPEQAKFPILQDDLDANSIFFDVENGVVSVFSQPTANIADGYITPQKTDFFGAKNENIADTRKVKEGFTVNELTGEPDPNLSCDLFEKIEIKSNTSYYFNRVVKLAWLNNAGAYISGEVVDEFDVLKVSPVGAKFISYSVYHGDASLLAESLTGIYYVPFEIAIKEEFIPILKNEDILDGTITQEKTNFYKGDAVSLNQFYFGAGNSTFSGTANFGQGIGTLNAITTAVGNYASGIRTMNKLTSGNGNVAVGVDTLRDATEVIDCTFMGWEAGMKQVTGVGDTGVGRRVLSFALKSGNNTGFGDSNLFRVQPNSVTNEGYANTSAGYVCMEYGFRNSNTVGIGRAVGRFVNSFDSVIIGEGAYPGQEIPFADRESDIVDVVTVGKRNVIVGQFALLYAESVDDVVAIGQLSFANLKANRNIGIGTSVGNGIVNGTQNILFGYGVQSVGDYSNCIVFGYNQNATADNQIIIGNSSHNSVEICGVNFTKAQLIALKALL